MSAFKSRFRILSTGFRYPESRLFYGRASLFFDRIELTGLGLSGRHLMVIALDDIREFEPAQTKNNLLSLRLKNDETIELVLNQHTLWEQYLSSRLAWRNRLENPPISSHEQTFVIGETAGVSQAMS